jgi:predicted GIY-YIG superfamily endonuclease
LGADVVQKHYRILPFASLAACLLLSPRGFAEPPTRATAEITADSQHELIGSVVQAAFRQTHDGWSSDEVLLRDDLNEDFVTACRQRLPTATPTELNWTLLNLRKAGGLYGRVTRRKAHRHDDYRHAAEIAARLITDRHEVSTDRMFCDVKLRAEFDAVARQIAPDVSAYRLRKAAFSLRKARQLRPELVVRISDWGREISAATVAELRAGEKTAPDLPGIYIFRDKTGYLYVGEAVNLRKRIGQHLSTSDRVSLADYLSQHADAGPVTVEMHSFPRDSPARATRMRRAYESELIASRKPRFNSRP